MSTAAPMLIGPRSRHRLEGMVIALAASVLLWSAPLVAWAYLVSIP